MKKPFRPPAGRRFGEPGRRKNERIEPRAAAHPAKTSLLYGVMPVLEALRANPRRIDKIFLAEGTRGPRFAEALELARQNSIVVSIVPRETIARQIGTDVNHQGILAMAAAADYVDLDELLDALADDALIVLADGIEDPQNLGALFRVVECVGGDGVVIPERRAVGLTDSAAKASAGAIEFVKVAKTPNMNRLIEDLKKRNIWVVGASGDADTSYTDWDLTRPTAIVLGSEGKGLHRLVAENCDVLVKIPNYGKIGSLNVAAAAAVILFEARRQRTKKKDE